MLENFKHNIANVNLELLKSKHFLLGLGSLFLEITPLSSFPETLKGTTDNNRHRSWPSIFKNKTNSLMIFWFWHYLQYLTVKQKADLNFSMSKE